MRHGKKFNHLGRTATHRKAMLSNMTSSLIQHKRITTTVAKAKALRKYVEPLITKAKTDSTHSRRVVFSYLQDKESVTTLFGDVAIKVGERPGGYTRIIKTGNRPGDNADMCIIELVDYNELLLSDAAAIPAKKSRRSRRGGKKKADQTTAVAEAAEVEEVVVEQSVVEDAVVEEPTVEAEEAPETNTEETLEAKSEEFSEGDKDEEKKEE